MPKMLTEAQVAGYHRDGFALPLTAFNPDTARRYRAELEAFEARIGTPLSGSLTPSKRKYRARTYLLYRWAHELVSHPAILDAIEDVIGPDILVFTTTWFIKEPGAPHVAGWHQDATHFDLEPAPASDFDPRAEEVHASAFEAYRASYLEQVAHHRAQRQ